MSKIQAWFGLLLGMAIVQPVLAAGPQPASGPYQLARTARSSAPGLHIRVVDGAGTAIYPIAVMVEYDSGAPAIGKATAEGFTAPAAIGRKVRAVTLGPPAPGQKPQRFDIDPTSANVMLFSQ